MRITKWRSMPDLSPQVRSEKTWWRLIHTAEAGSHHWAAPAIAKHISKSFESISVGDVPARTDLKVVAGRGLSCIVDDVSVVIGNEQHLRAEGIRSRLLQEHIQTLDELESCVLVAFDGEYAGMLAFADQIAHGAAESIAQLKADGLGVCMVCFMVVASPTLL